MKDTLRHVGREIMDFGRLVDENNRGNVQKVKTPNGYEIRWVAIDGL